MRTSRTLNEKTTYAGLEQDDLMIVLMSLFIPFLCLTPFGLEVFGPFFSVGVAIVLIPLRLKFRRKFLRDLVAYLFHRFVSKGVIYDPKNR